MTMLAVLPMAKKKPFQFFPQPSKREPRPGYLSEHLHQVPSGHLLSEYRMALLISPCCTRRLRIRIFENCHGWKHDQYARCPRCRYIWKVNLTLTELGFAKKAKLEIPRSRTTKKRLKK